MKRMQLVSQGTLARLHQEARMAWEQRDLRKCVEVLERIVRLSPADRNVLIRLGWMHGLLYDYSLAEEFFQRALRITPAEKKAEVLTQIVQQAGDFAQSELAERYLRQVIAETNASPEMLAKLAGFCERHRRTEEAAGLVEAALKKNADCAPALLLKGRLQHRAGDVANAEQILRSVIERSSDKEIKIRAAYELGTVLDRQEHYDEAMETFLHAKKLLGDDDAVRLKNERVAFLKRMKEAVDRISPDILKRWHEGGREFRPLYSLALLGGHPRSGTTLLEQVLDGHPEIVSIEETSHFTDYVEGPLNRRCAKASDLVNVLESAPEDFIMKSRNDYFRASQSCVGGRVGDRLLIDKNPSLTLSIPALARVFPEMKFLIVLRDPRDVVLSCFMQPILPVQHVSSMWLSLEMAAEEYAGLMGIWRKLAPLLPNPYLEVRYEDMVGDLKSVAQQALSFLNVSWDEKVLAFYEHAQKKRVRSPTYSDVTQKIFTRARGRWLNYQKYLEPHLAKLEPFVKAFGYE